LTRTAVITTARLELCAARPEDFLALCESVLSVPEVMRQVMSGQVLREDEARQFFTEKFDHTGTDQRPGVLVERAAAQVIGFAGLMPCSVLGASDFEIGFVLARTFRGRGYAQQIGRAQLTFGLSTLGCTRRAGAGVGAEPGVDGRARKDRHAPAQHGRIRRPWPAPHVRRHGGDLMHGAG